MEEHLTIDARGLGKDYYSHAVFDLLDDAYSFYEFLADAVVSFADGHVITGKLSVSSDVYTSIGGTIESIKLLTYAGRLNDVFALTRKLEDALLIDLYKSILIKQDEAKIIETDIPLVELLNDSIIRTWTRDTYKLFGYGKLNDIKNIIKAEDAHLSILLDFENDPFRSECNDNMHYNSWNNFALNVNEYLSLGNRGVKSLDLIYNILVRLLAIHYSFIYILHPEYYTASDYISALEMGETPEEGSQYWVASIIQDILDKYIKTYYKAVADYLIDKNIMQLE